MFGNELGKLSTEDANDREQVRWHEFRQRRSVRKEASRAADANTQVLTARGIPSTPSRDASCGDADPMYDNAPHGSPSTPTSPPNLVINPRLLETPDLDRSTVTQPSPPVPQTPDAPAASSRRTLSPLSNFSDRDDDTTTGAIQGGKRKRTASTAGQPRTRARRKSARA